MKIGKKLTIEETNFLRSLDFQQGEENIADLALIEHRPFDEWTFPGNDRIYRLPNTLSKEAAINRDRKDKNIIEATSLFFEMDGTDFRNQVDVIESLPIKPSYVIYSGGSSFHCHYVLEEPQKDLTAWEDRMDAFIKLARNVYVAVTGIDDPKKGPDIACKNRARLMAHPLHEYSPGINPWFTTSKIAVGHRYSWNELTDAFPTQVDNPTPVPVGFAVLGQITVRMEKEAILEIANNSDPLNAKLLTWLSVRTPNCPKYRPGNGDGAGRSDLISWLGKIRNSLWHDVFETDPEYKGSDQAWEFCKEYLHRFFSRFLEDGGNTPDIIKRGTKPEISTKAILHSVGYVKVDPIDEAIYEHCKPAYNATTDTLLMNGKPMSGIERLHKLMFTAGKCRLNKEGKEICFNKEDTIASFMTMACDYFVTDEIGDHFRNLKSSGSPHNHFLNKLPYDPEQLRSRLHSFFLCRGEFDITKEPTLADIQLRKWLAGAVNRALNPGCKNSSILILRGAQGVGKSTFFSTLGYEDKGTGWFDDSCTVDDFGSNDGLLNLHSAWIHELQELQLKKNNIQQTKRNITQATDKFRKAYAHGSKIYNRAFALCATTNDQHLYVDSSGNRRFWLIECDKKGFDQECPDVPIDNDLVYQLRDWIWACAADDLANGLQTYLTREEEAQNTINNDATLIEDHNIDRVYWALEYRPNSEDRCCPVYRKDGVLYMTLNELLDYADKNQIGHHASVPMDKRWHTQRELSRALQELGFKKTPNAIWINGGRKQRYYIVPDDFEAKMKIINADTSKSKIKQTINSK